MKELTAKQVEEVSGGIGLAGAGFGALTGAVTYLGNASTSGAFTWRGLATATISGGVSGALGGRVTSSVVRYLAPRVAFFGGAAEGLQ